MNETTKKLLSAANRALMDLHDTTGMDFCAPYGIEHIDGPYTVNKVIKLAAAGGYVPGDLLVILARDKRSFWACQDKFAIVTVEKGGDVEINHKAPYRSKGVGLKFFIRKGDFEEARKGKGAEAFVLWQKSEYLKKPENLPLDKKKRYKVTNAEYCYTSDMKSKYVDCLVLMKLEGNGVPIAYKVGRSTFTGRTGPAKVEDVIDKSGYFVQDRREDLKRRAAAIRAEREKAAFDKSDNSDKVADLARRICEKKAELVQMLSEANTSKEFSAVSRALSEWNGLPNAVSKFEWFREKVNRKSFRSISECEAEYEYIVKMMEGIKERGK